VTDGHEMKPTDLQFAVGTGTLNLLDNLRRDVQNGKLRPWVKLEAHDYAITSSTIRRSPERRSCSCTRAPGSSPARAPSSSRQA